MAIHLIRISFHIVKNIKCSKRYKCNWYFIPCPLYTKF